MIKDILATSGNPSQSTSLFPHMVAKPNPNTINTEKTNHFTNLDTPAGAARQFTLPFPKLTQSHRELNNHEHTHEFEEFLFSSVTNCTICNASFKSSLFLLAIFGQELYFENNILLTI